MRGLGNRWALLALLLCCGVVSGPAGAQDIDPAFRADIVKLMEVTGSGKLATQMGTLIGEQILESFKEANPDVPPRAYDVGKEVLIGALVDALQRPDGLLAQMVPVYAKHFNHDDVRGLLAFYDSPLGRKTIEKMPFLMQEAASIGMAWGRDETPQLEKVLLERLRAEGLLKAEPEAEDQ